MRTEHIIRVIHLDDGRIMNGSIPEYRNVGRRGALGLTNVENGTSSVTRAMIDSM